MMLLKFMRSKRNKPYPFILKMYGKLYKLECFYGKCMFRRCDSKGRVFRTHNIVQFKNK
jgi:hypothetical protein